LKNPDRLEALLMNEDRPVQIVFAGKAHPADENGKNLIREIFEFSKKANIRNRMIFLENYDIHMARYLVQGVDVWLNAPRRPQEASGTSGMKAAINGALNVSVLDGWWDEAYSPECGWAIGSGEEYDNTEYQDSVESQTLYNLLENDIVPLFYERKDGDIPTGWTKMMKATIRMVLASFTSHRMLSEYDSLFYQPALREHPVLLRDNAQRARLLGEHFDRLRSLWKGVRISPPRSERDMSSLHVGDSYKVCSDVELGALTPDEVEVEAYYGLANPENRPTASRTQSMVVAQDFGDGRYLYECEIACDQTGRYGLTARVTPKGTDWRSVVPGFITWAGSPS
jgi:starch phosphorylase